jgi:hypothetical protein
MRILGEPPAFRAPPRKPQIRHRPLQIKRRAFFSFHFVDSFRVNNVRQAWKIDHPDSASMRSFLDSSLWEARKLESADAIKRLITAGVKYTSAVCVLVGTDTWFRRFVRYEIARAVIDERGLLAVHINGLNHHRRGQPDLRGPNPLDYIGIYNAGSGKFYLYELLSRTDPLTGQVQWQWFKYDDYTMPVRLPRYMPEPGVGRVIPLSWCTKQYDYVADQGHKNIGSWIDEAARRVGR